MIEAVRKLACPVVLLTVASSDASEIDRAIVTSVSYSNLSPLVLSTPVSQHSRTGKILIAEKRFAISILAYDHLTCVEKFSEAQLADSAEATCESLLISSGFQIERSASGFLVVKNTQTIELAVKGVIAFDSEAQSSTNGDAEKGAYVLIIGAATAVAGEPLDSRPLIRYNRKYVTLDENSFAAGNDKYPV